MKHSRAAYLVNNAAVRVERESILHEVAARLPRRRRPPGPGRAENAVGDGDGVGIKVCIHFYKISPKILKIL
jgi:hypothetical protein